MTGSVVGGAVVGDNVVGGSVVAGSVVAGSVVGGNVVGGDVAGRDSVVMGAAVVGAAVVSGLEARVLSPPQLLAINTAATPPIIVNPMLRPVPCRHQQLRAVVGLGSRRIGVPFPRSGLARSAGAHGGQA